MVNLRPGKQLGHGTNSREQVLSYAPGAVCIRQARCTPEDPPWAVYSDGGNEGTVQLGVGNNAKQAWENALIGCRARNLTRRAYDKKAADKRARIQSQADSRSRRHQRFRDEGAAFMARRIMDRIAEKTPVTAPIIEICEAAVRAIEP